MKCAVWTTEHEIASTVASAIYAGFCKSDCNAFPPFDTRYHLDQGTIAAFDVHVGYGILRGMDDVFRACKKLGKPFIHLDKGYWKPGHYDGFYRVSLNGTQQTTFDGLQPDYARWDALGIEVLPHRIETSDDYELICPPTDYVAEHFGINPMEWLHNTLQGGTHKKVVRTKGTAAPIDWDHCSNVITFNSSVGLEALRQGIPVISNPQHSAVGAYQKKKLDIDLSTSLDKRREFFALLAGLQIRLDEIRQGGLWPLIQKLLRT